MPCNPLSAIFGEDFDSDQEDIDSDFENEYEEQVTKRLSYVGKAAKKVLTDYHWPQHRECWNVTHGRCVGEVAQSPPRHIWEVDVPRDGHSDSFPDLMYGVMVKTRRYLDFTSLSPPDGKFLTMIQKGLGEIARNADPDGDPVVVRFLFGNIIGMPVDCDHLIRQFVDENEYFDEDANIDLYVGAWRKGVTWNHSKIIAADGKYLFTGGHNLWDDHYLKKDPVHDLSFEAHGGVAIEGHCFTNLMWKFVEHTDRVLWFSNKIPDWVPVPTPFTGARVTTASWPEDGRYPPPYKRPNPEPAPLKDAVPMITVGRYGALHFNKDTANPADSAIEAMMDSAKTIIRMSLQDFGPLMVPGTTSLKTAAPGGKWPEKYLRALGEAIYQRGVDVEIVLSNPNACPGDLNPLTANYGNGWTCVDVACEIIKSIKKHEEVFDDGILWKMVKDNLRICYLRSKKNKGQWLPGKTIGNHAKFFMVDDQCYYLGSQNLYVCDLAEWGVIVDDIDQTKKVFTEYWHPLWKHSWQEEDCDVDKVMADLHIDRDGVDECELTEAQRIEIIKAQKASHGVSGASGAHLQDEEEENSYGAISLHGLGLG